MKMDVWVVECEVVNWSHSAQSRVQSQALLNAVMIHEVSENVGNLLTINFSKNECAPWS